MSFSHPSLLALRYRRYMPVTLKRDGDSIKYVLIIWIRMPLCSLPWVDLHNISFMSLMTMLSQLLEVVMLNSIMFKYQMSIMCLDLGLTFFWFLNLKKWEYCWVFISSISHNHYSKIFSKGGKISNKVNLWVKIN